MSQTLSVTDIKDKLSADSDAPLRGSKTLSTPVIFLMFTGLLLLCYAGVIIGTYGCYDDFLWLAGAFKHDLHFMQILQIVQGRPAMAVLFTAGFGAMTSVSDLRFLRLFSIITSAGLATALYRALVIAGHRRPASFFLALIMCTMPAFQVYVAWASTAFYSLGGLVAGMALFLAERAYVQTKAVPKYRLALASVVVLLASILIFQPSAMFYWVFAAILLLKPNASFSDIWRRMLWYGGICVAALAIGFEICTWGRNYYQTICPLPHRRTHLVTDIRGKIVWFFNQPLNTCLNFESLFPKARVARDVAIAIGAGMILYTKGKFSNRALLLLVALSIIPLSYLPNLVVEENGASFRTLSALSSLIVLYAFLALSGFRQTLSRWLREPFFAALMGSLAIATMAIAWRTTTTYFVIPYSSEFRILKGQINNQTHHFVSFNRVCMNMREPFLLVPAIKEEFGCPTSPIKWAREPMEYVLRHTDP